MSPFSFSKLHGQPVPELEAPAPGLAPPTPPVDVPAGGEQPAPGVEAASATLATNTGLTDTGLADTGLANTGLANTVPRLTGQPAGVLCPHCQRETEFALVMKLKVVACPECQGFLTQSRDFAGLVAAVRSQFRGVEVARPLVPAELRVSRNCPTCDKKMETHPYAGPGSVVVDSCPSCHTVWLDGGELERIERAPGRR
jgi:Zn-finger nucleic acid-binding protein